GGVYLYPGSFAVPWRRLTQSDARTVAASPSRTYLINSKGGVSVMNSRGTIKDWEHSQSWNVQAIAADENDTVFVLSEGSLYIVAGKELEPMPCSDEGKAVSAAEGAAYFVSASGELYRADRESCIPIPAPGRVSAVASFRERLVIVVDG